MKPKRLSARSEVLILIIFCLCFVFPIKYAGADSDNDGFSATIENESGTSLINSIKVLIPEESGSIDACGEQTPRVECLKDAANEPDLFVIIRPSNTGTSRFPSVSDPVSDELIGFFSAISDPKSSGG